MGKCCAVTGHREIAESDIEYIASELKREIIQAIEDGYTHFISGFARGVDLIFAEIVAELKTEHPIKLEAAIPYRKRMHTPDKKFQQLIKQCDIVGIHSEEYSSFCFMKRNHAMVRLSSRVIAVYDERKKGGTFSTIKCASSLEKEVRVIHIENGIELK
jgi:uncharacterized phage-like protein YoqJ